MKYLVFFLALLNVLNIYTLDIPKSSLETVKTHIQKQLTDAEKTEDKALIDKYKKELDITQKKIKKFEIEWLEYKKIQLTQKSNSSANITDNQKILNEVDALLIQLKKVQ